MYFYLYKRSRPINCHQTFNSWNMFCLKPNGAKYQNFKALTKHTHTSIDAMHNSIFFTQYSNNLNSSFILFERLWSKFYMIQLLILFNGYGQSTEPKRQNSSSKNKEEEKMAVEIKAESSVKCLHDTFKGSYTT